MDLKLVKKELLTAGELSWLNGYHQAVREALAPLLESEEKEWLARATESIG